MVLICIFQLSPPGPSVHGDARGNNTGVNCHALLKGIFQTQGSNQGLPHCRRILYYRRKSMLLFSRLVETNSLQPHGLPHARLPCPSPSPGACSNSCTLSRWCHPTISSSVVPFFSCFQSFPATGKESPLHIRWPKYYRFSFSISPSNDNSGLISLLSKGLSRVFSSTTVWKHQFFGAQPSLWSNSHICTWLLQKP